MRVLLVEDERKISSYIKRGLVEHGYAVDAAFTGRQALDLAELSPFDLIVLDILLPEIDGRTVCRILRRRRISTPILMLTARDSIEDRIAGLDSGADDYLIKPFAFPELLARIRALSRRVGEPPRSSVLRVADLSVDTINRKVLRGGRHVDLTAKEFAVLECMVREPGRTFTREMIANHVWNSDSFNQSNVVDVYVRNLRRKIDDHCERKLIRTIRGLGYRLSAGPDEP